MRNILSILFTIFLIGCSTSIPTQNITHTPVQEGWLLGKRGFQSSYLHPKWIEVKDNLAAPHWSDLENLSIEKMLYEVNRMANHRVHYVLDKEDVWQAPAQTLSLGGDCEDYSILKFSILLNLGIPNEDMRILIVTDTRYDLGHAVLLVRVDGVEYVLDNNSNRIRPISEITWFDPERAFNLNQHWRFISVT